MVPNARKMFLCLAEGLLTREKHPLRIVSWA